MGCMQSYARHAPMPPSVARHLATLPELRSDIYRNTNIAWETWKDLDTRVLPSDAVAKRLSVNNPDLVIQICEGNDRRADIVERILQRWLLPVSLQQQLVENGTILSRAGYYVVVLSPLEDSAKYVYAMKALNKRRKHRYTRAWIVEWLLTNPDIDDAAYLDVALSLYRMNAAGFVVTQVAALLLARPHLIPQMLNEGIENSVIVDAVAAGDIADVDDLAEQVLSETFEEARHIPVLPSILRALYARYEIAPETARRIEQYADELAERVDLEYKKVGLDAAFRSAPRIGKPYRDASVSEIERVVSHATANRNMFEGFRAVQHRDDVGLSTLRRVLEMLPYWFAGSAVCMDWYEQHVKRFKQRLQKDKQLFKHVKSSVATEWLCAEHVEGALARREQHSEQRELARTLTSLAPKFDGIVEAPAFEKLEPPYVLFDDRAHIIGVFDSYTNDDTGARVGAHATSRFIDEFGDCTTPESQVAWSTFVRIADSSTRDRTVADVIHAVHSLNT